MSLALSQICSFYQLFISESYNKTVDNPEQYADILQDIQPQFAMSTQWKNYYGMSDGYEAKILTNVGYCLTFNLLSASEIFNHQILDKNFFKSLEIESGSNRTAKFWDAESGYTTKSPYKSYPLRSVEADPKMGFDANMFTDDNINGTAHYNCEAGESGYKILFHNPYDWPQISNNFIRLSDRSKYDIKITPEIVKTPRPLKSYKPTQ